ncbi:unnamed protein product [Rotaria magnacalcarata]|uniref:Endonuclease/exonuclease/phosphatase domain-containing protein n=1 Tax=Rotaria magnacalcarata TaxID=392030 RepID=A0A820BM30_9BILA|nr:unnamed protein product [Rotaria magnacalcarata]CAF4208285.1 unnamed protein product [Rotaria magnacalcarata]
MKISVCHINITSIVKHKDELLAKFSTYDIISVNETNLKGERPFSLKGYNIFRNDRVGKSGGGILLAVKDHIKCSEILNETTGENEIVPIEIPAKSLFKSIIIASIYIPPKTRICCDVFHKLYKLNSNVMIVGDLNAALQHMGSRKTNARGRQLQDLLKEGYLYCIDGDSSTYERNDYEEKIDWILASQPFLSFISNVETHTAIDSTSGH